ncbi:MAG: protein kinase domain-containing protein [Phycisphaerales bacterium]
MDESGQSTSPKGAASAIRRLWSASDAPPSIPSFIAACSEFGAHSLPDALAADAHERLSRGLPADFALYAAAAPAILDNGEARRALLMCHATSRTDLDPDALRTYLLAQCPTAPADVGAILRLATLLRDAAQEREVSLTPGTRLGKYELKDPLGSGAFGDVWRAWDAMLQRYVALKVLKPGAAAATHRRFEAEARAAASIRHENVVAVHDAGVFSENGRFYIDSDLAGDPAPTPEDPRAVLPARTLSQVVRSVDSALHWREAARITAAIARGAAAAHARAVLHRDIKPANILLTSRGVPMLADFGLSVSTTGSESRGRIVGTPAFMAPEQASGEPATPLSDVYSIGATLVFLVTGLTPPDLALLPASAPREFRAIASKAASDDPAARYLTADQLARDLDALLAHRPVSALRSGYTRRLTLWYRRNAAAATVALCTVVIGAALGTKSIERIITERNRAVDAEHAALVSQQKAERAKAVAQATTKFMEDTLGAAIPAVGRADASLRAALTSASESASRGLDPEVRASVKYSIGRTLSSLSVLDRAELDLNEAVALRTELLGPMHRDTLLARHARAAVDLARARSAEAIAALAPLADDCATALGPDDPLVPAVLDLLGQALRNAGDNGRAAETLRRAYDARSRILGPDHAETLATLRNLGTVYVRAGDRDAAVDALTRAYDGTIRALGPDHHLTTLARQDLGTGCLTLGMPQQAAPHLRAAFESFRDRLGPGHVNTAVSGTNYASALFQLNEPAQAIRIIESFLPDARKQLGESSAHPLRAATVYAVALAAVGDQDRAVEVLEGVVKAARASGAARAPELASAAENLARIYAHRGDADRAARVRALIPNSQ